MKKITTSFFILLLCPSFAAAVPILLTHEGNGAGTIGGTAFANTSFVISAVGDTDNRVEIDFDTFAIEHDSASISIDGVGEFSFTTPTRTFVNDDLVGFSRSSGGGLGGEDLFNGPSVPALSPYVLLTSIGPVPGSGNLLQWDSVPNITTSGGVLNFDDMGGINSTFTARVVPEPASGILAVVASLVIALRRRS